MNKILALLLIATVLSSCSVVMASNKSGVDIESVRTAFTRAQWIALGAEPVITGKNEHGQIIETYKVQKERGSIARAFMHGLLDLSTVFLWEIAGTPIESALNEKKYYIVKVTFDESDQVKRMELL